MDFGGPSKKRSRRLKNALKHDFGDIYQHRLQFYKIPPTDTISLYEFEDFALERLKALKAVESANEKHIKGQDSHNSFMREELKKTSFKQLLKPNIADEEKEDEVQFRRLDHISHFILRLAYCKSEELKRWFLQQELEFFRYRFQLDSDKKEKMKFLELNNLKFELISSNEKKEILEKLAASANKSAGTVETMDYFKVHFTEALDLVQKRRVYVNRGHAYVPYDEMVSILLSVYRSHLSQALAITMRALPHMEEDGRLLPMLTALSKRYMSSDYSIKKKTAGQITADMIDMLSKRSFPPCMQQLHSSMRQNHHLRHGGRMQYGLFLKGIGLSLEEAMKFWRKEFTKLIDGDKFDKQYSYTIRHNYGKEGKRTNYTPYSCMKIIVSNAPGPGDNHGCPFKHMDPDLLRQRLKSQSIGDAYLERIMNDVKGSRFNVACTRYYEAVHKVPLDSQMQAFSHPNQWFDESETYYNGDSKNTGNMGVLRTPSTPRVKSQQSQGTPKSKVSSQGADTSVLSGIEEMDDDFNIEEIEMSMKNTQ